MTTSSNNPALIQKRRERILALHGEGLSDAAIADRLGLGFSTVQRHRRIGGIQLRPHGSLTPETVREIRRLSDEEGWPPGEIANHFGVSYDTIYAHLGKTPHGREWNKVARWAAKNHRALWEELKR